MPQTLLDITAAVRAAFHMTFGSTDADDGDVAYVPETIEQAEALRDLVASNTGLTAPRELFIELVGEQAPLPTYEAPPADETVEHWDPDRPQEPVQVSGLGQVEAPAAVTINGVAQALL